MRKTPRSKTISARRWRKKACGRRRKRRSAKPCNSTRITRRRTTISPRSTLASSRRWCSSRAGIIKRRLMPASRAIRKWKRCSLKKARRPDPDHPMLRQASHELTVATRGRGLYDFTREVEKWAVQNGFKEGWLTLHLQHTSASLLLQENADPDVRRDLESFFQRLVPDGDPLFSHTAEGDDDMPAHIRTALTAVNLNIPVRAGRLTLGTWQGI